jgi:hypothetical protein
LRGVEFAETAKEGRSIISKVLKNQSWAVIWEEILQPSVYIEEGVHKELDRVFQEKNRELSLRPFPS